MRDLHDNLLDSLTPSEFEQYVQSLLSSSEHRLLGFKTSHLERIPGTDGTYVFDVVSRFQVLGVEFLVLIECKHHKNPIKRKVVESLYSRMQSVGAQKGIIFSSAPFQRGAIDYAKIHGIALVIVASGSTSWQTRSLGRPSNPPPWANIPPIIGWRINIDDAGHETRTIFSSRNPEYLNNYLMEITD